MGLRIGQEYSFFTHEDEAGRRFICIECPGINPQILEEARRLVAKYGMKL